MMTRCAGGRVLAVFTIIIGSLAGPQAVARAQVAVAHVDSGQVLFSRRSTTVCSARLTTMMGLLLFLEQRDRSPLGSKSLERVTVPAQTTGLGRRPLELAAGESLSATEVIKAALLTSAPEAVQVLLGGLFPSTEQAAATLRRRALAIGLSSSSALPGRGGAAPAPAASPKTCSSLEGAAVLAGALLRRQEVARWIELEGIPFRDGKMILRRENPLVALTNERLPTGTAEPGYLVFMTANRNGLRLVSAATGPGAQTLASASLEQGLSEFELTTIVRAGDPVGSVAVTGGVVGTLAALARESVYAPIRHGQEPDLSVAVQLPARVEAPIAADQVLGELLVERSGKLWAVVPLVSSLPVAPASWLHLAKGETGAFPDRQPAGRGLFSPAR